MEIDSDGILAVVDLERQLRESQTQHNSLHLAVKEEVERLRKLESDCGGEIQRRQVGGQSRNVLAEGRHMTARTVADRLQAILDSEQGENK